MTGSVVHADPDPYAFLAGGGEVARLLRSYRWSGTEVGPIEGWPQSMKAATSLMLRSPVPMVMLWGPAGVMIYNDAYAVFAGGRHPDLLGSPVRDGWPEVAAFNDNVMRVGLDGGILSYKDQELTLFRSGRPEQVFMDLTYSPVLDARGAPAGVLAVVIETTERVVSQREQHAAEAALRSERDRVRDVLDNMAEGFILFDNDLRVVEINPEGMRHERRPRDAIVGRLQDEAWPAVRNSEVGRLCRRAVAERVPISLEFRYNWEDGRSAWFDMRAYPTEHGLALFYRDVTERHVSAEQRSVADAERSAILSQLDEGVIVTDGEGRIRFANEAAERLHGVKLLGAAPDDEGEGYRLFTETDDPYPPQELPLARAVLNGETVQGAHWRISRPDGTNVLATGSARPILAPDGTRVGALLTIRDDTQRRTAEARLREETRLLETLNRTGAALSAELDLERLVQMVSDAGVELTGARFGAYFHNVMDETGERLHLFTLSGADRRAFETLGRPRATAVFGPTFRNEGTIRSDDILLDPRYGGNVPHRGMPKGHLPVRSYLAVSVVSRSGEVLGGLLFGHPEPSRFTERHERLMVGLAAQAAIAIDNARLFKAAQTANETLEQRVAARTAELTETHEALRQAQKMEAVGQLTGGIAHDFNNLLTGIIGSLDLLQRKMSLGRMDDLVRHVTAATTSANRAAGLVHRLLAFSRRQPLDPRPVDANRLIRQMGELLGRTMGETVQIEAVLADDLWPTRCDPHQLESALLNLAINARDAMPGGGRLTIETLNERLAGGDAAHDHNIQPGDYVCIRVADTGIGMDRDTVAKAFEPFFTTKPIGQGTGLGLSMIYGFARQSDGLARIDSVPGTGTTFRLYLPRCAPADLPEDLAAATDEVRQGSGGGKLVLVVEDESAVRNLVVEVLADLGYRTLEAEDGPAGLAIVQSHEPIDLLVTDVGLPGLNGRQLADAARARRPDLKILLMTGYAENAAINSGFLEPGMELITKPFAVDALVRKLQAMAEQAPLQR